MAEFIEEAAQAAPDQVSAELRLRRARELDVEDYNG